VTDIKTAQFVQLKAGTHVSEVFANAQVAFVTSPAGSCLIPLAMLAPATVYSEQVIHVDDRQRYGRDKCG